MIVVDLEALACLLINSPRTSAARKALANTGVWVSAAIWRSQFLDALSEHILDEGLTVASAMEKVAVADFAIRVAHEVVSDTEILNVSLNARISASQATYLLVARKLGSKLITGSSIVAARFPREATSIDSFAVE